MEKTNLISITVGAAIAIIIVAAFLMPVIEDSGLEEKVIHSDNTGVEYYNPATSVTMTGNGGSSGHTEDFALSINGTSVNPAAYTIILASSTLNIILGENKEYHAMDVVNNEFAAAGYEDAISISVASGSYTASFGDKTLTGTIGDMLVWSGTEGSYALANAATVNKESAGLAYVGGILWGNSQGIAKISNLASGSQTYTAYTITDFVVTGSTTATLTWSVTNNEDGSYDISSFTDSGSATPINVFVPVEYYTLETTDDLNILKVIPVVVIVAILMAVLAAVVFRRN